MSLKTKVRKVLAKLSEVTCEMLAEIVVGVITDVRDPASDLDDNELVTLTATVKHFRSKSLIELANDHALIADLVECADSRTARLVCANFHLNPLDLVTDPASFAAIITATNHLIPNTCVLVKAALVHEHNSRN